jgi:thiamine transporter ThiT
LAERQEKSSCGVPGCGARGFDGAHMTSFILEMLLNTVLGGFTARWLIPLVTGVFANGTLAPYGEPSLIYCMLAALVCFLLNAGAKAWLIVSGTRIQLGDSKEINWSISIASVVVNTTVIKLIAINSMKYWSGIEIYTWLSAFVTAVALMTIAYALTFIPLVAQVSSGDR